MVAWKDAWLVVLTDWKGWSSADWKDGSDEPTAVEMAVLSVADWADDSVDL